jgi:hypothetical protein
MISSAMLAAEDPLRTNTPRNEVSCLVMTIYIRVYVMVFDYIIPYLFDTLEMEDTDVHFLHTSQFMLSVSDVRNYLNVWSGFIMFLPPNINIVCLQASSDPFIHSLFCSVKMASARAVSNFYFKMPIRKRVINFFYARVHNCI